MWDMPPKKPKKHKGVPEKLNPEVADDLPDQFTVQWHDPPVNGYKVVEPDSFDRRIGEILVWNEDAPLPDWAEGEGWLNVAGPEQVECRRRRRSGPKSAADYECEYRHRRGDSGHDDRDHDVEFRLDEMVFVEPGEDGYPDHWLPRYKPPWD